MRKSLAGCLISLLLLTPTVRAVEADPLIQPNQGPYPFAMSLSGGVSLGAYQAGFLHQQTQFLRANRNFFRPWIMTGSSAGAINALITTIEYCEAEPKPLEESLFWKTWTRTGFKQLTPKAAKDLTATAVFSREALLESARAIEKKWEQGLPKSCDMALGITTTLLTPETIELGQGLSAQRQTLRFIVRIRGRGEGLVPLVEDYSDANPESLQPHLYFDPVPEKRFAQLRDLVLASSAFPAAFDPVPMRFCRPSKKVTCDFVSSEEQRFVDGGILENQPLQLAFKIAKQSLQTGTDSRVSLREKPDVKSSGQTDPILDSLVVNHVDTDSRGFPALSTRLSQKDEQRFIAQLSKFGTDLITTARTRELSSMLEEMPKIQSRISSTPSSFPRASDPWLAFMGFFDAGFREFDFLLGMSDAARSFADMKFTKQLHSPDPLKAGENLKNKLACISAFSDPAGVSQKNVPDFCRSEELKNVRALAQTMWDRLAEGCLQKEPTEHERATFHSCKRPWASGVPEWIDARNSSLPWKRASGTLDEGAHLFKLLSQYGYRFDEGEFNKEDPPLAQVSAKIREQVNLLVQRQPAQDRSAVQSLGTTLANQIYYLAPERLAYITLGETSELGFLTRGLGFARLPYEWRIGAATQFTRPLDLFKKDHAAFTNALLLMAERDLDHYKSNSFILKAGLRAGYLNSALDQGGGRGCSFDSIDFVGFCSGATVQPSIDVTFMDRIRFHFIYRIVFPQGQNRTVAEPTVQLGFQTPI